MARISLLKFPYPFQACATVCSDIDGTSFNNFLLIHEFLNSSKNTKLGKGLSLPIGDSFWMFDETGNPNNAFSYFEGCSTKQSKHAPIIREFIKAGIIDVMHSYGNFSQRETFSRKLAIQALEELDKLGLKLQVWTNHGGLESVQNLGINSAGYGDVVDSPYYHADLLMDYGIKYYWDSELSLHTNAGQDAICQYGDAYWNSPLYRSSAEFLKYSAKGIIKYFDGLQNKFSGRRIMPRGTFDPSDNNLISEDKLRDGAHINRFRRFGHGKHDWSDDLPRLINSDFLEQLISKQGYAILYTHLGDRKQKSTESPLSVKTIDAFNLLAQYYRIGKIWVANTSTILRYNFIYKYLDWSTQALDQKLIININGLIEPYQEYHLTLNDIQGLSFLCQDELTDITIDLGGKIQKDVIEYSDNTGKRVVTVPVNEIDWPLTSVS